MSVHLAGSSMARPEEIAFLQRLHAIAIALSVDPNVNRSREELPSHALDMLDLARAVERVRIAAGGGRRAAAVSPDRFINDVRLVCGAGESVRGQAQA